MRNFKVLIAVVFVLTSTAYAIEKKTIELSVRGGNYDQERASLLKTIDTMKTEGKVSDCLDVSDRENGNIKFVCQKIEASSEVSDSHWNREYMEKWSNLVVPLLTAPGYYDPHRFSEDITYTNQPVQRLSWILSNF